MRVSVRTVFVRSTAMLRLLWSVLVLVTVAGPSFAVPMPAAAAPVVAATLGWSGFVAWLAVHDDFPVRTVAWLDASIFAALLVGEASLVPAPLIGDGTNWVFAGASVSVLMAAMLLSTAGSVAVTAVIICAYLAGIASAGESVLTPDGVPTSLVLIVQGLLDAGVVRALRRNAESADTALQREVADNRKLIVEERKQAERAAQERMLHDKVRSALVLVGNGHLRRRRATAVRNCQESLAALHDLREGRIAEDKAYSVAHAVDGALEWARSLGLDIRYAIGPVSQADPAVPAEVCTELGEATRQALANVHRHAGTDSADVGLAVADGTVEITVTDRGRGFDPGRSPRAGKGLSSSIVGRMRDIGGTAEIRSAPGLGTTVVLRWRPGVVPAGDSPDTGIALRLYGADTFQLLAAAGFVFQLLALYASLHYASDYFYPWLPPAAWAVQMAAGLTLAARIGHSARPWLMWAAVAVIVAAAASVTIDCRPRGVLGFANWSFGSTIWPLAFVAAYLPIRAVVAAVAVHDAIQTTIIAFKIGADLPGLLKLSAIALENAMLQAGFAIAFVILTRTTTVTARAAWNSGIARARLYAAQITHRSRTIRAAVIDEETYALLESVSSGVMDPEHPDTLRLFRAAERGLRRQDALSAALSGTDALASLSHEAIAADLELEILLGDSFAAFPATVGAPMVVVMAQALRLAAPGKARIMLHEHADMTRHDGIDDDPHNQHQAHSMTLTCTVRESDIAALRAAVEHYTTAEGAVLAFDLDFDRHEAPWPGTALVWLALAGR
ncbi:sensor histidine kinase [Catenulispora sp. MAP12-49]|uniref:sensor histidine kinase n=1 Tax=Catenulispora sp. MAP12-49 TaxID=3156302 RepID=UPI0035146F88